MQKLGLPLILFSLVIFLNSCSSVKVLNSWKDANINDVKEHNILVIARTNNVPARIAFENEIVKELAARGISATASFEKFPKLKPNREITEETEKEIKSIIMDNGFQGVILTVVKEEQELTKTVTDGGYYAGSTYYGFYPRYYNGFYGYYSHPMAYSTYGNYVEPTTTTYTAKNYILETVIYNLEKPEDKQLVGVVTSKLEEPENAATSAKQYVKAIAKSFDKK
jgi:hypothetical protein